MTGLFDIFTWFSPVVPFSVFSVLWVVLIPRLSLLWVPLAESVLPGLRGWWAGGVHLFLALVGLNFVGFLGFTFPLTTQVVATLSLAGSVWGGTVVLGLCRWRLNYFSMFFPSGAPLALGPLLVPVELASFLARPVSLGLRLAANLTAGHLLLHILGGSLHIIWFMSLGGAALGLVALVFVLLLELGVLLIQAFVFTLLSGIYLRDALEIH